MDSGCCDSKKILGLSLRNWSCESMTKDKVFLRQPLEAFYLLGYTAVNYRRGLFSCNSVLLFDVDNICGVKLASTMLRRKINISIL